MWQNKAEEKRQSLFDAIPTDWILSKDISDSLPKNLTKIPLNCGILSSLDIEITEIDEIEELADRIARGRYSAVDVTTAFCKRASIAHQLVNCLAEICFVEAFERAKFLDEYFRSTGGKTLGPLHGIPISFKDQFEIKGRETAMGYIGFLGRLAERNSILVESILQLGGIIYVKTTLPQTIMAGETQSPLLGVTLNPWNRSMSSGGSSGGEGALVALKGSICGFGTDIGGSIRIPCCVNGLYGLKPSSGRISYGYVKNSFDGQESIASVIGPMTRSLKNISFLLKSILDLKPWLNDPNVCPLPWRNDLFNEGQMKPLCFGVIRFDQCSQLSPPVQRALQMSIDALEKSGHQIVEWDTTDFPQAIEMAIKLFTADGGKDVQEALNLSGEPLLKTAIVGKPEDEISVHQYWKLNAMRRDFLLKYAEKWNQSQNLTKTGRPIDGFLSPIHPLPAFPSDFPLSAGYTAVFNFLQLSLVILPITRVDLQLDREIDSYRNSTKLNEIDEVYKNFYDDPEKFENSPIGLQVVCRRFEEEKAIRMAMILENALKSSFYSE